MSDIPVFVAHAVDRAGDTVHALFYDDAVVLVRPVAEDRGRGPGAAVAARQRARLAARSAQPGHARRTERIGREALAAAGRVLETHPRSALSGVRIRRSIFGYWTLRLSFTDGRLIKLGRGASGSEPYAVLAPLVRSWDPGARQGHSA